MELDRSRSVKEYQEEIVSKLRRMFGTNQVISEWNVAKDSRDALGRKLYCPRIDIAVGPFNIDGNVVRNREMIDNAYLRYENFICKLNSVSDGKISTEHLNKNPRCFLAIEIENTGTRKHRLGSIVNAAAIGKVGIIVTFTKESNNSFRKIRKYLQFIRNVKKIVEDISKNVIIISKNDFSNILEEHVRRPRPPSATRANPSSASSPVSRRSP